MAGSLVRLFYSYSYTLNMQKVYLVVQCLVSVQYKLALIEIVIGPESIQK